MTPTLRFPLRRWQYIPLLFVVLFAAACGGQAPRSDSGAGPIPSANGKLQVVATTTIVGDVVGAVGGDAIDLKVLLPPGAEPHSFQASPQDIARITDANLVFVNGLSLEEGLMPIITGAVPSGRIVAVSDGVELIESKDTDHENDHGVDPHTWTDPNNVLIWTQNIAGALAAAAPEHADTFAANAKAYTNALLALDAWVREQVNQLPPEHRRLVTDHAIFGYFAHRYGFEQVGAIVPGFSAVAEPSAQELAQVEDAIQALGVKAVFVGNTVKPALTQRVADDTEIELITVFSDSLSASDGPARSYLEYVRYNTNAFVSGLK